MPNAQMSNVHQDQVIYFTGGCVPVAAPLIWQVRAPGLDYPPAVAVLHLTIARPTAQAG